MCVLDTAVPAIEAYPRAATQGLPVHRMEYRLPSGRVAAALETIRALAGELFPAWHERFEQVSGRPATKNDGRSAWIMANAHELARGHKRLRALIEFALGEGWHVVRTPGGHLKFTKPGCA